MVFGPGEAVEPFYWSKLVTRIMVGCWKWIHNNKFLNTVYPWYKISHYSHITGCVILLLLKTLAKDTAEWVGKSYYNGWNKCQWVRSNIFPKREHIAHFLVFLKKMLCKNPKDRLWDVVAGMHHFDLEPRLFTIIGKCLFLTTSTSNLKFLKIFLWLLYLKVSNLIGDENSEQHNSSTLGIKVQGSTYEPQKKKKKIVCIYSVAYMKW